MTDLSGYDAVPHLRELLPVLAEIEKSSMGDMNCVDTLLFARHAFVEVDKLIDILEQRKLKRQLALEKGIPHFGLPVRTVHQLRADLETEGSSDA